MPHSAKTKCIRRSSGCFRGIFPGLRTFVHWSRTQKLQNLFRIATDRCHMIAMCHQSRVLESSRMTAIIFASFPPRQKDVRATCGPSVTAWWYRWISCPHDGFHASYLKARDCMCRATQFLYMIPHVPLLYMIRPVLDPTTINPPVLDASRLMAN